MVDLSLHSLLAVRAQVTEQVMIATASFVRRSNPEPCCAGGAGNTSAPSTAAPPAEQRLSPSPMKEDGQVGF